MPVLNIGEIIPEKKDDVDSSFSDFGLDDNSSAKGPRTFQLNADLIATGRTCVIGASGSGKSYTVGVICEELCKNKVPFVIIDIEGEFSGLKEKYEAVWVGEEEGCDLNWSTLDLSLLAEYAPDCAPLILDLSETDKPREKVARFLASIYRVISRRRTPYLIVLEEADRFAPQSGDKKERLQIFDEVARRGRKRGLGLMLCTQRPSLVDKNILSQCSNQLIGKLVIKNDLSSVAQFFSSSGLPTQLTTLSPGEFYALGGLVPEPQCVKIRQRETSHGGITPKLNAAAIRPSVEKIIANIEAGVSASQSLLLSAEQKIEEQSDERPALTSMLREKEEEEREYQPKQQEEEDNEEDGANARPRETFPRILGLAPLIDELSVPSIVKLGKSYRVFGEKESIAGVSLSWRPIALVSVRTRIGVIKKKFETMYFLLDGLTGKLTEVSDRLALREGFERLLGLTEGQVQILKALEPDKDLSIIEISSACRTLPDQSRKLLSGLESRRRLVRGSKVGRTKFYRRLVDLPRVELVKQNPLLSQEIESATPSAEQLPQPKISENDVREIFRGLFAEQDVEEYKVFYYPIYRVELLLHGKARELLLDGRSGKELSL